MNAYLTTAVSAKLASVDVDAVSAVTDKLTINPHAEGLRGQTSDAALAARISAGQRDAERQVPSRSVHQTILQTVRGIPGVSAVVFALRCADAYA